MIGTPNEMQPLSGEDEDQTYRITVDDKGKVSTNFGTVEEMEAEFGDKSSADMMDCEQENIDSNVVKEDEQDTLPPQISIIAPEGYDVDDFVDCARYGEIENVQAYLGLLEGETPLEKSLARRLILSPDSFSGNTALHMCAGNGHLNILEMLLPYISGEDINIVNANGNTAIHWAALNGHLEIAKLLVKCHARPQIKNSSGHSAIFLAEQQGHANVADGILSLLSVADN